MSDNLTLTAPERIYLWSEHTEGRDETFMGGNWSTGINTAFESVEYVRADLVPLHALLEAMDEEALKSRIAFLEKALKQAADNYFIVATLEKEIPKYTVSRDYVGQEVIILDGYSEQSFVATTEQLPELAQYLKERP